VNGLASGLVHGKRIGKSPISGSRFPANRASDHPFPNRISRFPVFWGVVSRFPIFDCRLAGIRIGKRAVSRFARDRESGSRGQRARVSLVWLDSGVRVPSSVLLRLGDPAGYFAGFIEVCPTIQGPRTQSWVRISGDVDHPASAQL
jgi:hypothetical protein